MLKTVSISVISINRLLVLPLPYKKKLFKLDEFAVVVLVDFLATYGDLSIKC